MICSVVPEKARLMEEYCHSLHKNVHLIDHRSPLGISIDYPHPEQIGADRLANAVATHAMFGCPAIALDFGTALTFDVISPAGGYLGGVITPGLITMTEGLSKRTALLPKISLAEPEHAIGKSTEEAMTIGAVTGYRGLVSEIIAKIEAEIGSQTTVVATGGDAELLARGLPKIQQVIPHLTLEGIRLVAIRHFLI